MTTKEKAQRYDEIIERARKEYKDHEAFKGFREMLERIFSEFNERGDDKIKETLIKFFKECQKCGDEDELFCGLSYNSILAWFEKQGEQKLGVKYVYPKFRIGDVIVHGDNTPVRVVYIGNGSYQCESDDLKIRCSFPISEENDYELVEQNAAWSEEDERIRKWLVEMVEELRKANPTNVEHNGMCSEAFAWLKKQGEHQKFINAVQIDDRVTRPSDNVGPKFHEGDWVVFKNRPEGSMYQVEKIENYEYILRHFLGGSMPLSFSHENMIRLWTVEDIMEGDVLAHDDGSLTIFGYRLRGLDTGLYMAHVVLRDKIESKQACAIANVHPATKEQRYILKRTMTNAGYEWDAKKRELKKIEQKSVWSDEDTKHFMRCKGYIEAYVEPRRDDVRWFKSLKDRVQPQPKQEWKQENIGDLTDFENLMMHIGGSFFGDNAGLDPNDTNAIKEQANLLLELVPKQEWSEEDEKILSDIVDCIKNLPIFYESLNINGEDKTTERFICDVINWLKSLKNRVQPQQKQEWCEEDEKRARQIKRIVHNAGHSRELQKQIADWLKSIEGRVQPKQEWSEEDLYRIEHALFGTYAVDFATRLLNKIKSLNSQNTWRPSDEQIEEFKDLLDDINWEGEILVSLYNDLKKLREE